ncbi:MAG: L-threonylcarbamoyladenylate synthase [Marinilabiliaceae bacterium]|jgi:tRNA threonylcarbamoyl adenosine modification protein (Sua5/YciO/YrdC/YwlC family)|nr:L-threonylcarbamoyladenylate synthase [Marinilabiliaceae bacterium]
MLVKLYESNPNLRQLRRVVEVLEGGGVVIYPTDSVYAIGCDIRSNKTIEKIARHKGFDPLRPNMSIIFHDMSQLAEYTIIRDNNIFKLIKRNTPGPFTFIVQANTQIPKLFKNRKKTVGIRIPANQVVLELVRELGAPIITTSVHDQDEIVEYTTDPELIYEKYRNFADLVIDGGYGNNEPTTIVDCTGDEPEIIRQGIGDLEF